MSKLVTILVFILAASFFSEDVKPQRVVRIDPKMVDLFDEAKILMKYKGEIDMPELIPSTNKELVQLYCPGTNCSISGLYFSGKIYYHDDLDMSDPVAKSIIVHEFIHHIQREIHGDTRDCKLWFSNEMEAYSLQKVYLQRRGVKTAFMDKYTKGLKCS